jgi:outer membrane protein
VRDSGRDCCDMTCAGYVVSGGRRSIGARRGLCACPPGLWRCLSRAGFGGGQARADTLAEAMAAAYLGNPVLQGERARQRATDEQVPQALSGWRPTVTLSGDGRLRMGQEHRRNGSGIPRRRPTTPTDDQELTTTPRHDFAIGLSQPIFRGFRTVSETARAEANVAAGQQTLLAVEQKVLLDATAAYMDVLRDRESWRCASATSRLWASSFAAPNARFNVGEITRTDVEQASARLSLAQAELAVARANLAAAAAFYVQVVGHAPGTLLYPQLPLWSRRASMRRWPRPIELNPEILAAAFNAEAARHQIGVVQADLLPRVSLEAEFRASHEPNAGVLSSQAGSVLGVLQVPLYQAGRVSSQVREAKQVASQRRIQIIEAGRAVREAVVRTWNVFQSSAETIASLEAQVAANELALEGVGQEALMGTRTTLDVLDAEQELVLSQVAIWPTPDATGWSPPIS